MKRRFERHPDAAFTLIELLTVIAIIGILASIVMGVGQRASATAKTARAKAELAVLSAALETYRRSYGDYPQTDDETQLLQALIGQRGPTNGAITGRSLIDMALFTTEQGRDPFTDDRSRLVDPWGQPYVYVYKAPATGWSNSGVVLYSVGPDGDDAPALLPGGFINVAAQANFDNIAANR